MNTLEKRPVLVPRRSNHPLPDTRSKVELSDWYTRLGDQAEWASPRFSHSDWKEVIVPHNWEDYHGYHEVSHGNLHGTAWYRTGFDWRDADNAEHLYAFFEGVGSYARVFCNGILVGEHAGGRTSFTVDLTPGLVSGRNLLAVRAHHPEKIDDLPFVCGGCWGSPNTEGSQPFGIFRPVWLERTGPVRVEPFGLHLLTTHLNHHAAQIEARVEIRNAGDSMVTLDLLTRITDPDGREVLSDMLSADFAPGEHRIITHHFSKLKSPLLWSPKTPNLYKAESEIQINGYSSHITSSTFGLRWLDWPARVPSDPSPAMAACEQIPTRKLLRSPSMPQTLQVLDPQITLASELTDQVNLHIDLEFEVKSPVDCHLFCEIQDQKGTVFFHQYRSALRLNQSTKHRWTVPSIHHPHLWTESDPCLHKLMIELRDPAGQIWERQETHFGIQQSDGNLAMPPSAPKSPPPLIQKKADQQGERRLLLNGNPFFINGTCEYETLLGSDHAFTAEQIAANIAMMKSAGFNAFRDAHHPHNLRYYEHWDREGFLCWTQMGSHIWFENDRFRANFRQLVTEWVRERRNHPCIVLWGIQNESIIPEDFARELCDLIYDLDPSTGTSRLTTTCNGGTGTDWNVPQEWSGTYGGNFNDYRLAPLQLVGEYGAWREFGVHTEIEYRGDENDRSESWACQAMEAKIRHGEQAREQAVGHFHWIFNSFPNPGRSADNYEGPDNAGIGSINNKGLITAWHQPSDLYYLFRANYANPATSPMVYLVSHTWPDRWAFPGRRKIRVFSNCDFVELFNGEEENSLGIRKNRGLGRHFVWNDIDLSSNVLCAVGWVAGQRVARDLILLNHLPDDGLLARWGAKHTAAPPTDCLHRISCGDKDGFVDRFGNLWTGDLTPTRDQNWSCESWAGHYPNVEPDLASRGYTMSPVAGTPVPELYRTYRYGRSKLKYHFSLPSGTYEIRLHFAETWFGIGGGIDCTGWRLFDIAIGGKVVARNLDVWKETGGDHRALIRSFHTHHEGGALSIEFPEIRVNQSILAGIEIFHKD